MLEPRLNLRVTSAGHVDANKPNIIGMTYAGIRLSNGSYESCRGDALLARALRLEPVLPGTT